MNKERYQSTSARRALALLNSPLDYLCMGNQAKRFVLKFKIKRDDWLLVNTLSQAANHCALFFETVLKFYNLGASFLRANTKYLSR